MKYTDFQELGFFVFPIKNNTKIPDVPKGYMKDRYDGNIGDLPITGRNYGIIIGKNRAVIDFDNVDLINEFTSDLDNLKRNTPITETGRGNHVFIECEGIDAGIKAKRDSDGAEIDIKGPRSYVVGPGSFYIPSQEEQKKYPEHKKNGFEYKTISNTKGILKMDFKSLINILKERGFIVSGKRGVKTIAKTGIVSGNRNNELFKLLAHARSSYSFSDEMIEDLATVFNEHRIIPPLNNYEIQNIIKSVCYRIEMGENLLKTRRQKYGR